MKPAGMHALRQAYRTVAAMANGFERDLTK
jgi:hypothetical protein